MDFFSKEDLNSSGVFIFDVAADDWGQSLFSVLSPPYEVKDDYAGQASFLRVWALATSDLGACSIVLEAYTSTDWNSEYSSVYCRVFQNIPQKAQRAHFFSKKIRYADLYSMPQELKDSYLGYTVIRPLQAFRVGDTVLARPCVVENSCRELVHSKAKFEVSLLGNRLEVIGMPFMQQDTTVGVCAEADLWMLARYFNKKGEIKRYRPGEITTLANKTITTGPGREGLFEFQMMDALRHMGLNPVNFTPPNAQEAKDFVYMCIESELPIIVGIPNPYHVFVAIGHDYIDDFTFPDQKDLHLSDAVGSFIVHDDASGPYIKMACSIVKEKVDEREVELLKLDGNLIDFCMTAIPHRVHMYWEDALNHAHIWLDKINQTVKAFVEDITDKAFIDDTIKDIWPEDQLGGFVIRAYLCLSSSFKSNLLFGQANELRDEKIIAKYKCLQMPKYIWVVELSRRTDLTSSIYDRKICGEIILDSTGNRHIIDETLIAFYLDGVMFVPGRDENDPELISIENPSSYAPLKRGV